MAAVNKQYPKLLSFLYLIYPSLYEQLAEFSSKSQLVEAKLISTNRLEMYQAIVFSEGDTSSGETFKLIFSDAMGVPYSWDWRWVFAVNVLYQDQNILPLKFKQKVIALPTGEHPLSSVFFNNLEHEFTVEINKVIDISNDNKIPIIDAYASLLS